MAEGLVVDPVSEDADNVEFDLHDGTATFLMEVDYPTPDLDSMYQSSVDTEGDPLVQQRYKNRVISGKLRVVGSTAAALQTTLGYLQQKAGKVNREGGTLVRTAPSGDTIAFDVIGCKFDVPVTGRLVTLNRAEVPFWFECKPFGRGPEVTLSAHSETSGPCLVFTETAIPGDVPALGRLMITEADAEDQAWVTWGLQSRYYDSSADAALFYQAEGRTPLSGAATAVGPTGSSGSGSNVVQHTAVGTSYQAILSTQATGGGNHLKHIGDFNVFARVYVLALGVVTTGVSFALEWGEGDFRTFTRNAPGTTDVNLTGQWCLVDLGQVHLSRVVAGTQRWEGRVLAKAPQPNITVYIDSLFLVPVTEGSGRVSIAPVSTASPTSYTARDEFDQTAGAVTGKTLPTGGTWGGAGDADDFSVVAGSTHNLQRTATADTSGFNNGRLITASGTSGLTTSAAQVDVAASANASEGGPGGGVLLRYVDSSNFLYAGIAWYPYASPGPYALIFGVVIAGAYTELGAVYGHGLTLGTSYTVLATVTNAGMVTADIPALGVSDTRFHSSLATGGVLASGKAGIYDYWKANASTRTYDNFRAWAPASDAAMFASQSLEIRHDRVVREDSGGTLWVTPTIYEGDYLLIPPAGREGRTNRFFVKASRGIPSAGVDGGIDDISGQLTYEPRYLVVPE